jgi:hypothetical protein
MPREQKKIDTVFEKNDPKFAREARSKATRDKSHNAPRLAFSFHVEPGTISTAVTSGKFCLPADAVLSKQR